MRTRRWRWVVLLALLLVGLGGPRVGWGAGARDPDASALGRWLKETWPSTNVAGIEVRNAE